MLWFSGQDMAVAEGPEPASVLEVEPRGLAGGWLWVWEKERPGMVPRLLADTRSAGDSVFSLTVGEEWPSGLAGVGGIRLSSELGGWREA